MVVAAASGTTWAASPVDVPEWSRTSIPSSVMEGPAGRSIVQETHDEAMRFRRALGALGPETVYQDFTHSLPGVYVRLV